MPNKLPPPNLPPLDYDHLDLLERANRSLGRLDGLSALLPDASLFIYFYVRKEAVLSSQIEGTQSSLSELLLFEETQPGGVPMDDVQEVSRYVAALNYGIKRMREDGFPLSLRLLREIHAVLLGAGRGSDKEPGEFRSSQNWIGGTRPGNATYVPPPPAELAACLGDLELFLHSREPALPLLVRAALVHVQFESIHPFLDGNGRLGRLLVMLLLVHEGAMSEPLLYLSLYLKQHRDRYYQLLQAVREQGDWLSWIRFFLEGVRETSASATDTARRIMALFATDHERVGRLGRSANSALRVHEYLQRRPISSVSGAADATGLTFPTVQAAFSALGDLGLLTEVTGKQRGKIYAYNEYLRVLSEGA